MSGLDPSLILPQLVHRRATGAAGDAPFLAETGGPWHSYALIDDNARRLAGALVGMGVRRGDRVGVLLPTSVTSIVAWLACGWIGALEVPIHAEYRGAMLHHVLAHSGASVVLADAALLAAVFAIDGGLPGIDHLIVVPSIAGGPEEPPVEAPAHWRARMLAFDTLDSDPVAAESGPAYWDIASIVYTSGTTGPAKGVMVPWRQFYKHGEIVFPPGIHRATPAGTRMSRRLRCSYRLSDSQPFDSMRWVVLSLRRPHRGKSLLRELNGHDAFDALARLLAGEEIEPWCATAPAFDRLRTALSGTDADVSPLDLAVLLRQALRSTSRPAPGGMTRL